jgi:hypothetical protein
MWYVVMSLRVHLATSMMLLPLKKNSLLKEWVVDHVESMVLAVEALF